MATHSFTRSEHLKSRKIISSLFKEGKTFSIYPIRVFYIKIEPIDKKTPVEFTASVPTKNFKKATDRNRIRRQIKEAYRLHKHIFYNKLEGKSNLAVLFLYVARDSVDYSAITQSVRRIIKQLPKLLEVP